MMQQPDLFSDRIAPPVNGRKVKTAKRCRQIGHISASLTRDTIWRDMLDLYDRCGPCTDAEMATVLGVERSTINARRDELVRLGKVRDTGTTRINQKSGKPNTLWGLV